MMEKLLRTRVYEVQLLAFQLSEAEAHRLRSLRGR